MKATIYLSDDSVLTITDFDPESALDLGAELHELRFAQFTMDDATVIVNTDHILRIDLE